jgi:hypothetical protein
MFVNDYLSSLYETLFYTKKSKELLADMTEDEIDTAAAKSLF